MNMKMIESALKTTAIVLAVIFVARKVPMVNTAVNKALVG